MYEPEAVAVFEAVFDAVVVKLFSTTMFRLSISAEVPRARARQYSSAAVHKILLIKTIQQRSRMN